MTLDARPGPRVAGDASTTSRRRSTRARGPRGPARGSRTPTGRCAPTCTAARRIELGAARATTVMVPREAVQRAEDAPLVFVRLAEDVFEARRVEAGPAPRRDARRGRVAASRPGEPVATDGQLPAQDRDAEGQHRRRLLRGRSERVLTAIIDWSLRHRVVVLLAWAGDRRRRRARVRAPAHRRLPRHHAGAGADQHRRAGAGAGRDRAADHLSDRAGDRRPAAAGARCARSRSSACRRSSVTFEDGTDIYFARQLINERLGTRRAARRASSGPQMGPVATGLGEVFHYVVTGDGQRRRPSCARSTTGSSSPQLRTVPGVAEINSWGGYEKQYQVRIDPDAAASSTA